MTNFRIVELIGDKFHVNKHLINSILTKINEKQCDEIAIISVVGPHFEGNTFAINLILNCLERGDQGNWPHNVTLTYGYGFRNIGTNTANGQAKNPGIEMWDKPFIKEQDGKKVAILLVNLQNYQYQFEDLIKNTSLMQMFRLISKISTVFIVNQKRLNLRRQSHQDIKNQFVYNVVSYEMLIDLIDNWELFDNRKTVDNFRQILKEFKESQEFEREFNQKNSYLTACPTDTVKYTDWKVADLNREYVQQITEFIKTKVLNVNNWPGSKIFTNTGDIMDTIENSIKIFNDPDNSQPDSWTKISLNAQAISDDNAQTDDEKTKLIETNLDYTATDHDNSFGMLSEFNKETDVSDQDQIDTNTLSGQITNNTPEPNKPVPNGHQSDPSQKAPDDSDLTLKAPDNKVAESPQNNQISDEDSETGAEPTDIYTKEELDEYLATLITKYKQGVFDIIDKTESDITKALDMGHKSVKTKVMDEFNTVLKEGNDTKLVQECRQSLDRDMDLEKTNFEAICDKRVNIGDQLMAELGDKYSDLFRQEIDVNFKHYINGKNLDQIYKPTVKAINELFASKATELKGLQKSYSTKLQQIMADKTFKYMEFRKICADFEANCGQLCQRDEYLINDEHLYSYLLEKSAILDSFQGDYYLVKKYDELTKHNIKLYKDNILEINDKNIKIVLKCTETAHNLYTTEMSKLLRSGTFTGEILLQKHNAMYDTVWTGITRKISLTTFKPNVILKCQADVKNKLAQLYVDYSRVNSDNHKFIKNTMNEITLKLYKEYCVRFRDKLAKCMHLTDDQFEQAHENVLGQLWPVQEQLIKNSFTEQNKGFDDKYVSEMVDKNRLYITDNIVCRKQKYKHINNDKKDKSHSLVVQFNDKPTGAYFNRQKGGAENVPDPFGDSAVNCIAFNGNRILYGCNAELYLNGNAYDIKDIMGRDVSTNEDLTKYRLNVVQKNPVKVRLVFTDTTQASVDLNVESLFALQVLDMKSRAETEFKNYMQNVLFIVPTSYTIRQIQAVKDSAKIAGIEHAYILSQMSAAVIDFGFNTNLYERNLNFREVLVILISHNECDLALIEYYGQSIKYIAYKCGATNGDDSVIKKKFSNWVSKLFDKRKKVFDCLITGDQSIITKFDFVPSLKKYCSKITINDDSLITRGAVLYSNHYENNGKLIPITGVVLRDVMCHMEFNDGKHVAVAHLLRRNELASTNTYTKFKLTDDIKFPIRLLITEGPECVVKRYLINNFPGYNNKWRNLYIFITMDHKIGNELNFNISASVSDRYKSVFRVARLDEIKLDINAVEINEQAKLVDSLIKYPIVYEIENEQVEMMDTNDYYTNVDHNNKVQVQKNNINKQPIKQTQFKLPITTQVKVDEKHLDDFIRQQIDHYQTRISMDVTTGETDVQKYNQISTNIRRDIMNAFNREFSNKQPVNLIKTYGTILGQLMDNEDTKCKAIINELVNKNSKKYKNLIENCVKEFNDSMNAAIDQDINANGLDNHYNMLFTRINNDTINAFNEKSKYLSQFHRQKYRSELTTNMTTCADKYRFLYECNDKYREVCRRKISVDRYFNAGKLTELQFKVPVPTIVKDNVYLMEKLAIMFGKTMSYFNQKLEHIYQGEKQIAVQAVNKATDLYEHILALKLKSRYYSLLYIEAIHQTLTKMILNILQVSCNFNASQNDLTQYCSDSCHAKIDTIYHDTLANYKAKVSRLFTLSNDITRDMHIQFCHSVKKGMSGGFIKTDSLQKTLEYEMGVTMAAQKSRITALKQDWDDGLVEAIVEKKAVKLKFKLYTQIYQYKLQNFLKVTDTNYLGICLARDFLIGTYFNGKVQYVPDTNGENYVDNSIAYKNSFIFGAEARGYLADTCGSFDIKDLLWKDWADEAELMRYPFRDWLKNPLRYNLKPQIDQDTVHRLNVETMVALQALHIKHSAETLMKHAVRMAVFTIRTDYRIRQRAILRDVAKIAGFDKTYLITEITAAGIAYIIDNPMDSKAKEIIMVFALDHDQCAHGVIKVSNSTMEYLSYGIQSVENLLEVRTHGTGSSYPIIRDFIINQLSLSDTYLSKILVVGHSARLPEFQRHITAHFEPRSVLYDCHPRDVIARGTAYYGQMLEKRLDAIDIREVIKMPIKMMLYMNNKSETHELMDQNVSVFDYRQKREVVTNVSAANFPIEVAILEAGEEIKSYRIESPPLPTWGRPIDKLGDTFLPWNTLHVGYHMDQDTLDIHFSATLKARYGNDYPITLKDNKCRLTQEDIEGQRSILNELGMFKTAPVETLNTDSKPIPGTSTGQVLHPGKSVPKPPVEINRRAAPVDEFSAFCAGIRERLDANSDVHRIKKSKLLDKLTTCEDIVRKDGKQLDSQKKELLKMIDTFNLTDKLIQR